MNKEPHKALFLHNSTGSRLYRILPQAKYMAKQGWDVKVRGLKAGQTGGIPDMFLKWADIVVVEMTYSPQFIKAIKNAGAKIVYELDDLMESVSKVHYAYKEMNWWRTYLTWRCLTKVDAITCTVQALKDRYKWFNPNIHILPNLIDIPFWEKPYLPNTSKYIRIGWIGGNSHKEDLKFIAPIMEKVLRKYPNVKFVCTGYGGTSAPDKWVEYNYGEDLFKNLPKEQYEFSLGAPITVFPNKVASLRLDIALAPVVENKFARCKSHCKSLEYGVNRIPGVYQRFLYKDSVIEGKTGYLATTPEEWYEKLCLLIENKNRREMGEQAYIHIKKNFNFKDQAHKWLKLYESLLADSNVME